MVSSNDRAIWVTVLVAVLCAGAWAGEGTKGGEEPLYADAEAGFKLKVPFGWRRVTEREVRELFRGILRAFGREATEAALRRPPVYFEGPNPRDTMKIWPNFGVGYIPERFMVDPDQASAYKDQIERYMRGEKQECDGLEVTVCRIDGALSLRMDYGTRRESVTPLKMLMTRFLIPAADRTLEVVFAYDPSQQKEMQATIDQVLESFQVERAAGGDWTSRWGRIALITAAGFAVGVLFGLVLHWRSRRRESSGPAPAGTPDGGKS